MKPQTQNFCIQNLTRLKMCKDVLLQSIEMIYFSMANDSEQSFFHSELLSNVNSLKNRVVMIESLIADCELWTQEPLTEKDFYDIQINSNESSEEKTKMIALKSEFRQVCQKLVTQPVIEQKEPELAVNNEKTFDNECSQSFTNDSSSDYNYQGHINPTGHKSVYKDEVVKKALKMCKVMRVREVSHELGVPSQTIKRWQKIKEQKNGPKTGFRDVNLDGKVVTYIKKFIKDNGHKPCAQNIQKKAKALCSNPNFQGSSSWYSKFMKRNRHLFDK